MRSAAALAITLLLLGSPVSAQQPAPELTTVDSPTLAVGDAWTYRLINGKQSTWAVSSVADDYYLVRTQVDPKPWDLRLPRNPIEIHTAPVWRVPGQSADKIMWPLETRKKWSVFTDAQGGAGPWRADWTVVKVETVSVTAGTFQAFRIEDTECNMKYNNCGQIIMWYAPQVKNVVKIYWGDTAYWDNNTRGKSQEVIKYQVQ